MHFAWFAIISSGAIVGFNDLLEDWKMYKSESLKYFVIRERSEYPSREF